MPLKHGKSKKAFEHNVKAEMHAGKPQDQSLAIAYSVQRKARHKKMAEGGKLSAEAREHIKTKNFALPEERKYPIEDASHARNALARVSQHGTPAEKAEVQAKVHKKYPDIGKAEGGEVKVGHMKIKRIDNPSLVQSRLKVREGHSLDRRFEHEDGEPRQEKSAYAEGGVISANNERRPSTQEEDNDKEMIRRMADGGILDAVSERRPNIDDREMDYDEEELDNLHSHMDEPIPVDEYIATHEGAMDDQEADRADRIMLRRAMAHGGSMYAFGGETTHERDMDDILSHDAIDNSEDEEADLSRNAQEDVNHEDDLSHRALEKENYSLSDALDSLAQPADSNEHGDDEEKERENRADRIMLKRAKRNR